MIMAIPPTISQVGYPGAGDIDDCFVVGTVWAAVAADPNAHRPTVTAFRAAANNPNVLGDTGGTLDDKMQGAASAWPYLERTRYDSAKWGPLAARLRAGASASLGLLSSGLPKGLQFGFQGDHTVGVVFANGKFLVANPLAPNGSRPKACAEAILRAAAREHGSGSILAAVFAPWEAKGVKFDPKGSPALGVVVSTRDTKVTRWDGARIPFPARTRRRVFAIVSLGGGRRAYVISFRDQGHYLVADDRATFTPA